MSVNAAVLINLTIGSFSNERTDSEASKDIATMYNANSTAGRYVRKRLPDEALSHIRSLQREMRRYHSKVASPWMDGGIRILAAKMIPRYNKEFKRIDGLIKAEVENMCIELPKIVALAQGTRGKLFHQSDFPTPDQLRHSFRMDVEVLPVPNKEDFRVDFISNKIKKDLTRRNAERYAHQTEYVRGQFRVLLERLQKNMIQDAPRIRSSTITQLTWLRQNLAEIMLDSKQVAPLRKTLTPIESVVIAEFDEEARPKFNPLAVDEARVVIDQALEELK